MNDQERGFLDAIIEEPDDDTHRLVYSDWLEDHGQPERAEFIRLQIEHAKRGHRKPRIAPFPARIRELLDEHEEAWTCEVHPDLDRVFFWRGFVDEWDTSIEEYTRIGEAVHRRTPLTTFVLDPDGLETEHLRQLADTPCLANLRHLFLRNAGLTDRDLQPLLTSPHLTNLHTLDLEDNEFTGRTITRLIESTSFPSLRRLVLDSNDVSADAVAKLAKAPLLGQLESLSLYWCLIGNKGVRALGRSSQLGHLRELDLSLNSCDGKAIGLLLDNPSSVHLDTLYLYDNPIGRVGVEAVARASHRFDFRRLGLDDCELEADSLDALLTARLNSLKFLKLGGNKFGDEALARFLAAVELPELTELHLTETGAATKTIDVLLDKFPHRLDELHLDGNPLRDSEFVRIVESPLVENLRQLSLGHSIMDQTAKMTTKTAHAILGSEFLDNILELQLRGNTFSDSMKKKLQKRFGERVEFE